MHGTIKQRDTCPSGKNTSQEEKNMKITLLQKSINL